jgi:hypothetical protein
VSRNFAQLCAQDGGDTAEAGAFDDGLSCDMRGIVKMLGQVQSFYQETTLDAVIVDAKGVVLATYITNYANLFAQYPEWRLGSSGTQQIVPVNWGNFPVGSDIYTTTDNWIGNSTPPSNVTISNGWVYLNASPGSQSDLILGGAFASTNYRCDDDGASINFSITVVGSPFGLTQSC